MLVGRIVVDDGMDRLSRRDLRLDGVEEADELLVPVALHVAADDSAVEDVEGGEQRRRAMAFVVVGHGSGAALLHRQAGLGAIKGLDLALLINREDAVAFLLWTGRREPRRAALGRRGPFRALTQVNACCRGVADSTTMADPSTVD